MCFPNMGTELVPIMGMVPILRSTLSSTLFLLIIGERRLLWAPLLISSYMGTTFCLDSTLKLNYGGIWGPKSEGVGLIVRVISFVDFLPM